MNQSKQHYDVIIIGGGFAGCALAYHFSKAKLKTLLLEQKNICSGTSAACAGRAQIIESETEDYLKIVHEGFLKIPSLNEELDVDLEWELPGHLTLIKSEENYQSMQKKISLLNNHGINSEMLDMQSLQKLEPNLCLDNILAAVYSAEGHINPFRFCFGFLNAARRNNAKIVTHQKVIKFSTSKNKITSVHTTDNVYSGDTIILASGAWTNQITRL
ncbi:MAG TPA: FAD-dependent oxidoreductase, partial [Anaerolineaceae bacterium]|nr:FAD-dependent oxidoreductase [Anaerolineaceae bacterium]